MDISIDELVTGKTVYAIRCKGIIVKENTIGEPHGKRGYDFLVRQDYFYVPSEIAERFSNMPISENDAIEEQILRDLEKELLEHNKRKFKLALRGIDIEEIRLILRVQNYQNKFLTPLYN